MIEPSDEQISVRRQCQLLGVNRSGLYYRPIGLDNMTILLMRLIDEEFTRHPFYGSRRMLEYLKSLGYTINRKRIQSLYYLMGLETLFPKKNLSKRNNEHKIFP